MQELTELYKPTGDMQGKGSREKQSSSSQKRYKRDWLCVKRGWSVKCLGESCT